MDVLTLISKVQEEKPNSFTNSKLVSYINEIEAEVAEQLDVAAPTYTGDPQTTENLLAPAPYDRLYVSYVKAMIDYANEEYASYQNNQAQHIQDFADFCDWVVRTGIARRTMVRKRFRNVF